MRALSLAPGAIDASAGSPAEVRLQFRAAGSRTVTFVSVVLPAFVTVISNFALPRPGSPASGERRSSERHACR